MDVSTRTAAEVKHDSDERPPLGSYVTFMAVYTAAFGGALVAARLAGRELPRFSFGDVVLFGLATQKLSRLLAKDKVTAPLRSPFAEHEGRGGPGEVEERPRGQGARRAVGELVTCPYCLDQWVAAGFAVTAVFAPQASRLAAGVFATVAVADFLQLGFKAGQEAI